MTKTKKAGPNRQCAAIPYVIKDGHVQVLLLTSRGTGRWIVPKGWPKKKHSAAETAALEAFEEGGVVGDVTPEPIGSYTYTKALNCGALQPLAVDVFALRVRYEALDWPERGQRKRVWVTPEEASLMVAELELADLLARFASVERRARAAHEGAFVRSPVANMPI
ncbi:NUDIX hydrolase [Caenispirillum bisanense]|uniref:8-oxo-dGTP pyrophosphatase MutT, NUDIX family n=1 Tax=Caenispirillum bisanense TaxID=414052 RepID=A0A286G1F7_9PROT|nr:NUDIX hydrolase [Caenispirillum bisanense]SOD89355.1 8-oxo-dGTP pyrophosphatase MutT, NUDIX family [Caenispirillum bisanense]